LLLEITKHCICLLVTPGYSHHPHQPLPLAQQASVELGFWASKPLFGICPLLFLSVQQSIEWCQRCKFKTVYGLENSIPMFLNIGTGGALQTGVSEQEEVVDDKVE